MAHFRALPSATLAALVVLSNCVGVPATGAPDESPSVTTETPTSTTAESTPTDPTTPTETDE